MAKQRTLRVQFPVGGVDRSVGYQNQPPYTTPDCLNVRPRGPLRDRTRGGSRPGLVKAYDELLGGGAKVRMLSSVRVLRPTAITEWNEEFLTDAFDDDGKLGDVWTAGTWDGALPPVLPDLGASLTNTGERSAVRDALDIATSQPYTVSIFIVPYFGSFGGKYRIHARMDDSDPDSDDTGITAEIILNDDTGDYTGSLTVTNGGTSAVLPFDPGTGDVEAGWFKVLINGDDITCYWQGTELLTNTIGAQTGTRFGFSLDPTVYDVACLVELFRITYYDSTSTRRFRSWLVASANGELWREVTPGTLEKLTTDLTIESDRMIQAQPRLQKLYIADHGDPVASEDDGVIANDDELSSDSVDDWTALDFNIYDYVCVISNAQGDTTDDVYEISAIAADKVTLASEPGNGTCSFSIERGPKIYDPVEDTLTLWTADTAGIIPVGCPAIGLYRDRLILAGNPAHVWYMSRQGGPLDWDYAASETDAQRAVAGTTSDAGRLGEPVTAVAPWGDDGVIFGAETSLWVLRGDPALGGNIDSFERVVGPVYRGAWCYGPHGEFMFLTNDGIYMVGPGMSSVPQRFSAERMPADLQHLDPVAHELLMYYDVEHRGVHLYISLRDGGDVRHWFADWETRGFFPMTLHGDHEPFALYHYTPMNAPDAGLLLGGRDGYIRKPSSSAATDDGTAFTNYVVCGPIRGWTDGIHDAKVAELRGTLASASGDVTWSLHTGDRAESSVSADANDSGTWESGVNRPDRPRARCGAFALKLTGANGVMWAMEDVIATLTPGGKQRT